MHEPVHATNPIVPITVNTIPNDIPYFFVVTSEILNKTPIPTIAINKNVNIPTPEHKINEFLFSVVKLIFHLQKRYHLLLLKK